MAEDPVADDAAAPPGVSFTLDGRELEAHPGELLIAAAERHGVYIPHFCYHPRMEPVGMCRMCLVEVDTGRGPALQPSCMLSVTPDMKVDTESATTKKAQEGVLEFLLINHPLDCPVCDKGGECPLQDQTMAYGPGESRFVEEKRHHEKPIPISDLVLLDRERCILCDRCTRFAKEVAGDPLIHFQHRGSQTEVNTFPDHPFSSYFSGNTVQICPVGALTSEPYRFTARPWDLTESESTCQGCSVGCRVAVQSSRDEVVRLLGVDSDPVNWGWLCDKGRYGYEALHHAARLASPMVRRDGGLVVAGWSDVLSRTATALREAVDARGPGSVGIIGGARLTNEAAYAWTALAKGVLGTDNVDAQLGDGLPAELVLGHARATIDDACRPGGTVVVLGPDVKEELPVLFLRLRHAATNDGVRIIEVVPRSGGLSEYATATLTYRPGEVAEVVRALVGTPGQTNDAGGADAEALAAARAALAADGPVTMIAGRGSVAEGEQLVADAAGSLLAARPDVRVLSGLRRGNVHGALDMGMAPGLLPGRTSLADGADPFRSAWPTLPSATGLDTRGMLEAAANGRLQVLVLVGADPLGDFPDATLAEEALEAVGTLISVDTFTNRSTRQADVVLAAAGFGEVTGTSTSLEGRVTRLNQQVTPPGTARADWMIAVEVADRLGHDLGATTADDLLEQIQRLASAYAGVTPDLLAEATDGVVVPLDDRPAALPAPHAPVELPPRDAYSLRLVTSRRLYDLGVTVQHAEHLAGLAPGSVLSLNQYDFDRLGVDSDSHVRVSSTRGSLVTRVVVDAGVPRGAAAVSLNQPELDASRLIDSGTPVIEVRVDAEGVS
jgi:NADH-quinone oxidoreductase subunit G